MGENMAIAEYEPRLFNDHIKGHFLDEHDAVIDTTAIDTYKKFHDETAAFWIDNLDLFGGQGLQPGIVLQYGETSNGDITEIDDDMRTSHPRTLIFQAISPLDFRWKLVEVHDTGRVETFLSVRRKECETESVYFDKQGRKRSQECLDEKNAHDTKMKIIKVINSHLFIEQANALRKRREAAGEAIGLFALTEALSYTPEKARRLLDKKKEVLDKLYLSPLKATR